MRLSDLTEKYEMKTRAGDHGAFDGASNLPETQSTQISTTELNIRNVAQDDLDDLGREQRRKIDEEHAGIMKRVPEIPFVVKRTPGEFQVDAESIVQQGADELVAVYNEKLEKENNYRLFKVYHGLRRDAAPARSLFEAWAYIALMLALDGCLNAFFFKDIGSLGLADGFIIAAMMAACNIALGFMIGWGPLRYFAHRFKLHLLWAIPVFIILVMSIGMFNWGVAHFRDLVQVNREGGFRDLWSILQNNPFGILNFASYLMGMVGIGIAIYAAARAYTMFDSYPWYGWHHKRMKAAEAEFIAKVAPIKEKVHAASVEFLGKAASDYETFNNAAHQILSDYGKIASRIDEYQANALTIEDACNSAIKTYQVHSEQVRNTPPPGYFGTRFGLRQREDLTSKTEFNLERKALQERVDQLRLAQEELEKKVPAIKLALLSEKAMNDRMDSIVRKASDKRATNRQLEDDERMIAA
jgi:hypothetical protein